MALPFLDIVLAVLRRTRAGQLPWKPDRGHIHHQLLRLGLTHRDAMLALTAISAALAITAVALGTLPAE